jgi:hypothetical protein
VEAGAQGEHKLQVWPGRWRPLLRGAGLLLALLPGAPLSTGALAAALRQCSPRKPAAPAPPPAAQPSRVHCPSNPLPPVPLPARPPARPQRGYLPSMTHSSHYIRDPQLRYAVAKFLEKERDDITYTLQAGRRRRCC